MTPDLTPHVIVSLLALGMALAFLSADRDSPTSRALAVALAAAGLSIDLNIVVGLRYELPPSVTCWFGWTEAIAMFGILEWVRGVRRMVPTRGLNTLGGDIGLRVGQAAALAYGVLALVFPEERSTQFLGALGTADAVHKTGFWIFAVPVLLVAMAGGAGIRLLLNRRPDRPERVRLVAMGLAIPFFVASMVLPLEHNAIAMVVGEIIFLIGAVHYHMLQGQRGQFLSRFLSPDVAQLVAERGLARAMQENQLEVTVVSCDLRGFTPYAQAQSSEVVLQLLREYYDVVGAAVAHFNGTIKDYAGDGVLILLGAPLPVPDHARLGIALARRIRDDVQARTAQWNRPGHPLGIGLGVATGTVTVGVIGGNARLEYTAVGSAVNLACRLCEQAAAGEILVDENTARLAQEPGLEVRPAQPVRGFGEHWPRYAVPTA